MKQVMLSKKEIKGLNKEIHESFGIEDFFSMKDPVKIANGEFIVLDNKVIFFYSDSRLVPTLHLLLVKNVLKDVVVDMGAVRFVTKGSDIMRPGIVGVDAYVERGDIVVIRDENNMKPLAVGESLFSKAELENMEAGKVILNLHYVGDSIWKLDRLLTTKK